MKSVLVLLSLFLAGQLHAQSDTLKKILYALEDRIMIGDRAALRKLAPYLDNKTEVLEHLGYHRYPNFANRIARRILGENCLFDKEGFVFDSSATMEKFLQFLDKDSVIFDLVSGRFLVTGLEKRTTTYRLRKLSEEELKRVDSDVLKTPFKNWYYENQIDWFRRFNNNQALLWIAAAWYQRRLRFNKYYYDDDDFLNLMKSLTHVEVGVPDQNGVTTFLYNDDYYAIRRLNYLLYWSNHYDEYKWDSTKNYFVNTAESATEKSADEKLFSLLASKNDSIALDAFQRLAESDTGKIKVLANDYYKNGIESNSALPMFTYRFLAQMALLTEYCRDNKINYKPSGWVRDSVEKLKMKLHFGERYRLENSLVDRLSVDDIAMVEYFGLLNEQNWECTYSIGRVIDKFYSRNWNQVVGSKKYICDVLKKSKLFDGLGIIGNCNKYLRKFEFSPSNVLDSVRGILYSTSDQNIKEQAEKVLKKNQLLDIQLKKKENKSKDPRIKNGVRNFNKKYVKIKNGTGSEDDKYDRVAKLASSISYSQIGNMLKVLKEDTILGNDNKFYTLKEDFGIEIDEDDSAEVAEFIGVYNKMKEPELYKFYLVKYGINCIDKNGEFLYSEVNNVLKYDVVDAFVGGGGGRRETGVYLLIKLLEFKFHTRLGFPKKKCSTEGLYSCDCTDQANAWMRFLEKMKLVKKDSEPQSMSY